MIIFDACLSYTILDVGITGLCVLTLARRELPVRATFHFGGPEGSVPTVASSVSVVVSAARLQTAGPLLGAFFRVAFTLLYPPLAGDLLDTMPLLSTTEEKQGINRGQ